MEYLVREQSKRSSDPKCILIRSVAGFRAGELTDFQRALLVALSAGTASLDSGARGKGGGVFVWLGTKFSSVCALAYVTLQYSRRSLRQQRMEHEIFSTPRIHSQARLRGD